MGVKQDAWNAEISAFDAAVSSYQTAKTTLNDAWIAFNSFLDAFTAGGAATQEEWNTWTMVLRRATLTKGARFEAGVETRPAETHASFFSTLAPMYLAITNLYDQALILIDDPTVPNNVRNAIGRIDFAAGEIVYSPAGIIYSVEGGTGKISAPHWWMIPNQFSEWILRGRGQPTLGDDIENARARMSIRFSPTIDDSPMFDLRDECSGITGID